MPRATTMLRPLLLVLLLAAARVCCADRIVLDGVGILTMNDGGEVAHDRCLIVEGDRITAIIPREAYSFAAGDAWIRWDGVWVIPAPVALDVAAATPADLRALMAAGFTTATVAPALAECLADWQADRWSDYAAPRIHVVSLDHDASASRLNTDWASSTRVQVPWIPEEALNEASAAIETQNRSQFVSVRPPNYPIIAVNGHGPVLLVDSLHDELLRVAEIIGHEAAIRAWTRNAAIAAGLGDDQGRIAVGQRAELLILEVDPRQNIAACLHPRAVMATDPRTRESRLFYPAEIDVNRAEAQTANDRESLARRDVGRGSLLPAAASRTDWVLRIDGLINSTQRLEVAPTDSGFFLRTRINRYPPATATIDIDLQTDALGRLQSSTVSLDSSYQQFSLSLTRQGHRLDVDAHVAGSPQRTDGIDLDTQADVTVDELLLACRIAQCEAPPWGQQLDFGFGPIGLRPMPVFIDASDASTPASPLADSRSIGRRTLHPIDDPNSLIQVEFDADRIPTRVEIDTEFGHVQYERISP